MTVNIDINSQGDDTNVGHSADESGNVTEQVVVASTSKFWDGKKTPCQVTFGAGLTIPTQPYANARPYVCLTIPADIEHLQPAYDYCQNWVDEKLTDIRKSIEAAI